MNPNYCYSTSGVSVDGSSQGAIQSYPFHNDGTSTQTHNITASYTINTYTITATAGGGGTITPSATVTCGSSKTFYITPNSCYHILNVQVDGVSQGAITSYTFSGVTANHMISATFAINTYTITATAGSGGTISPSGSVVVNCGSNAIFAITPNSCYHITDVQADGVSQGAITSYTFPSVTMSHTISAAFSNTYTVNVSKSGTGTGTVISSPTGINCGPASTNCGATFLQDCPSAPSSVTLTATPSVDSSLVGWSGDCTGTNCLLTMNGNKAVTSTFNILPPVADFSGSPTTGFAPLSVTFADLTINSPTSWSWSFGNGESSTLKNPSPVVYLSPGTYTVSLTSTNPSGSNTNTKSGYITVQACPNLPVRINRSTPVYYADLQSAYNAAVTGDVIQAQGVDFIGDLNINQPVVTAVTFEGGYDCGFTSWVRDTNLHGMVRTSAGTTIIKNMISRQ